MSNYIIVQWSNSYIIQPNNNNNNDFMFKNERYILHHGGQNQG